MCEVYGAVNGGPEGLRIYPSDGEPLHGLGQSLDLRMAFREITLVSVEDPGAGGGRLGKGQNSFEPHQPSLALTIISFPFAPSLARSQAIAVVSSGLGTQVAAINPALASHMGHRVPLTPLRNQSRRLGRAAPHCPLPFQVEKSLQRIQNGQRNAMYTSQQSVENKVGGIPGWQALLTAVGFRLDPPTSGLPAAVFFPTSDPGDRLQQCSSTIQSLLGEPQAGQGP